MRPVSYSAMNNGDVNRMTLRMGLMMMLTMMMLKMMSLMMEGEMTP